MKRFTQFVTESTKTFPVVKDRSSRYGAYPDAERAAAFARAETKRTGQQHVVSSDMGRLCYDCAPTWMDSHPDDVGTLTVEPGNHCYNCDDQS